VFGLVSDSAVDSSKRRGLALDSLATAHSGGASSREPVILFLFLLCEVHQRWCFDATMRVDNGATLPACYYSYWIFPSPFMPYGSSQFL
jgi:hypothetical protein